MNRAAFLGSVAGALLALTACNPPAHEASQARVLSTFAAGRSELVYELVIEPCVASQCPLRVRLLRGSSQLDTRPLEWGSPTRELKEEVVGPGWGVGDVLGPTPGMRGWLADMDATGFATVARPVKLSDERIALLVTQRTGVEPSRRRHDLFSLDGDRLVSLWSRAEEAAGPAWTSTHVLPAKEGREQVLYVDGYWGASSSGEEPPDTLELVTLWWDPSRGQLAEGPAADTTPLELVSFGAYPTVAAAYEAKSDCLFRYWILDSALFEGLPPQGTFIGAITSDPSLAREALAEAGRCETPVRGSILPYKRR